MSSNAYSTYINIRRVLKVNTETQKKKSDIMSLITAKEKFKMDGFLLIAKSCVCLDENLFNAVPQALSERQSRFGSKWLTSDSWQCFPSGRNILALHKFLTRFQIAAVSTFSEDQRVSLTKQKVRAEEDVRS